MPTFKDSQNQEWTIKLDGPAIHRVRAATCDVEGRCSHVPTRGCTGVDLVDLSGEIQRRLEADPVLLVNTLYLLCEPQAKQLGITDEQFGARLFGDALGDATMAMVEAISDFFPSRTRKVLKAVTLRDTEVRKIAADLAMEQINNPALVEEVRAKLEANFKSELGKLLTPLNSATNSPAS